MTLRVWWLIWGQLVAHLAGAVLMTAGLLGSLVLIVLGDPGQRLATLLGLCSYGLLESLVVDTEKS